MIREGSPRRDGQVKPAPAAAKVERVHRSTMCSMTHGLFQRIEDRARRVWRKHLFHRLPEERGARRIEPLGDWCVVPVDATFGINLEHETRKRGQRRVKVRARLPKSFLGCLAVGDVARRAPTRTRGVRSSRLP